MEMKIKTCCNGIPGLAAQKEAQQDATVRQPHKVSLLVDAASMHPVSFLFLLVAFHLPRTGAVDCPLSVASDLIQYQAKSSLQIRSH